MLAACGGGTTSGGAHAKAPGDVEATLTVHISTSYETTYPNGGTVGESASLDWSLTWVGQISIAGGDVPINKSWTLNHMTGAVSWHGTRPNGELTCSGTLSEAPGLSQAQLNPLLGAQGSLSAGHFDLVGSVPTATQLVSSDTNQADAQCNTSVAVTYLQNGPSQGSVSPQVMSRWQELIAPRTTTALRGGRHFDPGSFSVHWSGPQPPVNGATTTLTDDGNWTFS